MQQPVIQRLSAREKRVSVIRALWLGQCLEAFCVGLTSCIQQAASDETSASSVVTKERRDLEANEDRCIPVVFMIVWHLLGGSD